MKVEPERCLRVGDRWERDVEGALAAGLKAGWLDRLGKGSTGKLPLDAGTINFGGFVGLKDDWASIANKSINILTKMFNMITIGIMVQTFAVSAFSMNAPIPLADSPTRFGLGGGMELFFVVGFLNYF